MKYDKNKVFTAYDIQKLKQLEIGSVCFFADTFLDLEIAIENKAFGVLTKIKKDTARLFVNLDGNAFEMVYFTDEVKKLDYVPFECLEEAKKVIDKHNGWVKNKDDESCHFITSYHKGVFRKDYGVVVNDVFYFFEDLFRYFVFLDDDTPCGKQTIVRDNTKEEPSTESAEPTEKDTIRLLAAGLDIILQE